jgi:hypothetical protein
MAVTSPEHEFLDKLLREDLDRAVPGGSEARRTNVTLALDEETLDSGGG